MYTATCHSPKLSRMATMWLGVGVPSTREWGRRWAVRQESYAWDRPLNRTCNIQARFTFAGPRIRLLFDTRFPRLDICYASPRGSRPEFEVISHRKCPPGRFENSSAGEVREFGEQPAATCRQPCPVALWLIWLQWEPVPDRTWSDESICLRQDRIFIIYKII